MSIDKRDAIELLDFTAGTRDDFHEPDEQGIELVDIVGTKLDNAFGNEINAKMILDGFQEAVVVLRRDGDDRYQGDRTLAINLATLFALARLGAAQLS